MSRTSSPRWILGGILPLVLLGLSFLVLEFWPIRPLPWPTWNCVTQEVNVVSGRARFRSYRFFRQTQEKVEDTVVSLALRDAPESDPEEGWRMVNQFAPPSIGFSPQYAMHGALGQIRNVGYAFAWESLSPERQDEIAQELLRIWRTQGRWRAANDLVDAVGAEAQALATGQDQPTGPP